MTRTKCFGMDDEKIRHFVTTAFLLSAFWGVLVWGRFVPNPQSSIRQLPILGDR